MIRRMILVLSVIVGGFARFAGPLAVRAQTPASDVQQPFRFELGEAPASHRGRAVEGYVYNDVPWRITNVRLRVECLESGGEVTSEASGWVVGDVRAGGRAYFFVPVSTRAATYRATVQSFDKVGPEAPRTEAP